jgi:hypothetical protein
MSTGFARLFGWIGARGLTLLQGSPVQCEDGVRPVVVPRNSCEDKVEDWGYTYFDEVEP